MRFQFPALTATLTNALSSIGEFTMSGAAATATATHDHGSVMTIEVENTGGQTTNAFNILEKATGDSTAGLGYLGGTDFDSTSNYNMIFSSAMGPHELTAGSKALVHFRVHAGYSITFQASTSNTNGTTISVKASVANAGA